MKSARRTSLKRKATLAVVMVGAATLAQILPAGGVASGQTVASANAQAAAIAARLNYLGGQVSQLVDKYNSAQTSLAQVNQEADNAQTQVTQTQVKITSLKSELTTEAINAYMTGGNLTELSALLTENPTQSSVRQEFLNLVTNSQTDLVASFESTTQNLQLQQASLKTLQAQAVTVLNQVTAAKNATQSAVDQEKAQLDSVNSTIAALVAQQQAYLQQVAQQQAYLQQVAAAKARQIIIDSSSNAFNPPPSGAEVTPALGVYSNPLRAIGGLSQERIDQGVDFKGYGPIYAIGNGVVLSTTNGGWPGGVFISYRLTSGPAAGLVVYVAEDVKPQVSVGQRVTSASLLGTMYEGFDGIETGWANSSQLGETMARYAGQFGGANSTAYGFNFSQLLRSVGSPGGILQNNPPSGTLQRGWPQW